MSFNQLTAGKDIPQDLFVVVEIPANSQPIKYEIDKDMDALMVDRFMATPMFYPANYGYVPQTLADDGDPIDVLVVTPYPVAPGSVVRCRPIGVLKMTDEKGEDVKVLAVPHQKLSANYNHIHEYTDLPEMLLKQIEHFFENYKDLEPNKWVKIDQWQGQKEACELILKSVEAYKE